MEDTQEPIKNVEKTYTDPVTGKFVEGNPGGGRPKGSFSIKERIRRRLQENPQELQEFEDYFVNKNRDLAWQMLEGRPQQNTDVTSNGETVAPLLVKFIDGKEPDRNTEGV